MTSLHPWREAGLYFVFGFCSDVAATRFCLAASQRHILPAIISNLVLMVLNICMVRKVKSTWLMAAWIGGQSLGIWVALAL